VKPVSILESVTLGLLCLLFPAFLSAQWSTDPAHNNAICTAAGDQTLPVTASDGAGGAIIAWNDGRVGLRTYAQRINAAGTTQWTTDGVLVSSTGVSPTIISDGAGGAIIAFTDFRGSDADIYVQRIDASGNLLWSSGGVAICTATGDQEYQTLVGDGSGGAIVCWDDPRNGSYDVYSQRVDASGTVQWTVNGVSLCSAAGDQVRPVIASDGAGGAVVAWNDYRAGASSDIYAQRINASGSVQWTVNGVVVSTAASDQESAVILQDGSGGAIIAWQDHRNSNFDIYAQHIRSDSTTLWTANGVAICTATDQQLSPSIAGDGSGGAIISWYDHRNGTDYNIYAQHMNASGISQWTTDGLSVCTASGDQEYPAIISDDLGGSLITWYDFRSGSNDIYAQRIGPLGTPQWTSNGVVLSSASGDQLSPTLASDGAGGGIVVWYDYRNGSSDIYAQRVDLLGNLYPEPWIDAVGDIANDQGGKLEVLWKPSPLDSWGTSTVRSYTVMMGTKTSGQLGKTERTAGDGIYWRTLGTVAADWSSGYNAVAATSADSGLLGIPVYYFRVVANNEDSTVFWSSNVDSGYSIDNIPPVGISGGSIANPGSGTIRLSWHKDRVDADVMGYQVFRSLTSGFSLDSAHRYVLAIDTTFTDSSVNAGQRYYYRIAAEDIHGNLGAPTDELSGTAEVLASFVATAPREFTLSQNYPNPFNPATTIEFTIPEDGRVSLKIYDIIGREVETLVDESRKAGVYQQAVFDGTRFASGVYFYRMAVAGSKGDKFVSSRKMMLVK